MVTEAAVLDALKVVKDPDLHQDIVTLGFIKNLKIESDRVSRVPGMRSICSRVCSCMRSPHIGQSLASVA